MNKELHLGREIRNLLSADEHARYLKTIDHFPALGNLNAPPPVPSVSGKTAEKEKSLKLDMMKYPKKREWRERMKAELEREMKSKKRAVQENTF